MAVFLTISNVFVANSQEPIVTEECISNISAFQELVKNKYQVIQILFPI